MYRYWPIPTYVFNVLFGKRVEGVKFLLSTLSFSFQRINLPACRRVLWILLVRSCTVCFVFVFVYTFPLARIFASSNLNPPPFFVSSSSFLTFWWAQLCPRLAQHRLGFAQLAVVSMVVSVCLLCLPSVCSVASCIQYLIHWLLCRTPFTRITFLNMAFSKPFLNMAFSKTLVYTHALV